MREGRVGGDKYFESVQFCTVRLGGSETRAEARPRLFFCNLYTK